MRPLLSFDTSLVLQTNAILNDHLIDDLATDDTAPCTNSVMPASARPNEEIHRTHEAMATMTIHPMVAPIIIVTVLL
jgi:hypothetical protein